MDNETKNRLANRVQVATAEDLQTIVCPECHRGLDLQFVSKVKKGKGAGSLSVICAHCLWRVVSDGIPVEPPWVRHLGSKIHTAAAPSATLKEPTVAT